MIDVSSGAEEREDLIVFVFFSGESLCPHSGTPIEQERWRFGA
jgi:hypothetical protein